MKKRYITLIVIILALLVLGCAGSNSGNTSTTSSDNSQQVKTQAVEQPATTEPLTILDSKITYEEIGGYTVTGTAKANKDLSYAEVTSKCYDANGAVIGSYIANMQNLKKGETWNFKILGPFDNSVTVAKYTVSNGNSF